MNEQLETNQSPPSTSHPASPQPPVAVPPKKKMSKGLLWGIIGGAVGLLIIIVAAIFIALSLRGETKQGYQPAIDAALETSGLYSDYLVGVLPRAQLQFANPAPGALNDMLEPIEKNEREIAKKILVSEKALDEKAAELDDDAAKQKYQEYLDMRTELYGEGKDITQYIERVIVGYRFQYSCERLFSEDNKIDYYDVNSAKQFAAYVDGCTESLGTILEGDVFDDAAKTAFATLKEYLEKTSGTVKKMIADNKIDKNKLKALDKEYEKKLNDAEADMSPVADKDTTLSLDTLQEKLDEYFDFLVDKRNAAAGSNDIESYTPEKLDEELKKIEEEFKDAPGFES